MSWDETLQIQIAETFVEEASGYSSEKEFVFALYQEIMISRRRETARDRMRRRRDIVRGMRGFVIEEVQCRECGRSFGRLQGGIGRPRVYCSNSCQSRSSTRQWRWRV
jgi:hypothetical protein